MRRKLPDYSDDSKDGITWINADKLRENFMSIGYCYNAVQKRLIESNLIIDHSQE